MVQSKTLLKIFHVSVAALNSYAIWYDQMYIDLPFPSKDIEALSFKARYIFLTVWCLVLQIVYFSVSFLNDISGTNAPSPKNPPLIRRVKDILFSLAFTVAIYVAVVFWVIYSIHKDLIFPPEIESRIPPWVNQVMHTLIVPFIFIELFVTQRKYPTRRFGFGLTMSFIFAYTLLVFFLYFKTDVWVYPFMDQMDWNLRFIFFGTSAGAAYGVYILGEKLNSVVCPSASAKAYTNGVNGHSKSH